jgi:hypothetical protein
MLRWVVLVLILLNALYFAWHQYALGSRSGGSAGAVPLQARGEPLTLLGGGASLPPASAPEDTVAMCHMIGPFAEQISARQVRDRLRALDIAVELYEMQVPQRIDYWVHLSPRATRKAAVELLRELQAKGIDSFLITEGELTNGISLGFFSREELALATLEERRRQGYSAASHPVQRFSSEIWAVYSEASGEPLPDQAWQRISAGIQGLERRKNLCDAIASAQRLE